jgi:hypothetical protein
VKRTLPIEFIRRERNRVFQPGASFARNVVSGLDPLARPAGLVWDYVPSFARPIVALATVILLAVVGVRVFYPLPPAVISDVGIVDAYLATDAAPVEEWLYRDAEPPEGEDLLIHISVAESEWGGE